MLNPSTMRADRARWVDVGEDENMLGEIAEGSGLTGSGELTFEVDEEELATWGATPLSQACDNNSAAVIRSV